MAAESAVPSDREVGRVRLSQPGAMLADVPGPGISAVVGLLYLASAQYVVVLNDPVDAGAGFWPAAGVSVAALLLLPRKKWAWVLGAVGAAEIGGDVLQGYPPVAYLPWALANMAEPLVAALLLQRFGAGSRLAPLRDLLLFLLFAVLVGPTVGALIGSVGTHLAFGTEYPTVVMKWMVGDGLGVLVVAPLLLTIGRWPAGPAIGIEAAVLALLTVCATGIAFFPPVTDLAAGLPYLTMPCLIWAALRFGTAGAAAAGFVIAQGANIATGFGWGPFGMAAGPEEHAVTLLQMFLGISLATGLMVAALTSELTSRTEFQRILEERAEELRESEARLRDFAAIGSDWLWETDENFRVSSVHGGTPGEQQEAVTTGIGRTRWDVASGPQDAKHWKEHIERHQQRQPFRNFTYELTDARGEKRYFSASGNPVFDKAGTFVGYRGVSNEITERIRAELEQTFSAAQQHMVAHLSQKALGEAPEHELLDDAARAIASILSVDFVSILRRSEEAGGYLLQAGFGWPHDAGQLFVPLASPALALFEEASGPIIGTPDSAQVPLSSQAREAGVQTAVGIRLGKLNKPSGALVAYSKHKRVFTPGEISFLEAIAFILTAVADRESAQEVLRLRDRALAAINQGIVITSATQPDNPITYCNDAFMAITGYSPAEVTGRNCRLLQGRDTDRTVVAEMRKSVEEGTPFRGTILNYKKDGTPFWNELTISPIPGSGGVVSHFVGTLSDATERVMLEARLSHAEKMESLGHLTGGLAHDFNNLTAIMLGNAEILEDGVPDPEMKQVAHQIIEAAERAAGLTAQLLAFGRRETLKQEVIDLALIIPGFTSMLRRTLGQHIAVESRIALHPAMVLADRSLLETALLNLCLNARDAMPEGGTLSICVQPCRPAAIPAELGPGDYTMITVQDTGTGMEPAVLERATEPFFTTKEVGKGSGLGLSMVYGFARQSGGHVAIESQPDEGTSVHLFLVRPNALPATDTTVRPRPIANLSGTESVLVVEDEPAVRRYVTRQIQELGYHVLEAETGAEALRILESRPDLDLLFTDIVLPGGMSGIELARQAGRIAPGIKVLFTSGYSDESAAASGGDRVSLLRKPYRRADLGRAIRRVLEPAPADRGRP